MSFLFLRLVEDVQVCRLKGSLSVLIGRSAGCVSPGMPAGTFFGAVDNGVTGIKKKGGKKSGKGDKSTGRKQQSGREKLSSEGG